MIGANTPWEKMFVSGDTAKYLDSYNLWSRLHDGIHVFVVVPPDKFPKESDTEFTSIAMALMAHQTSMGLI